MAKTTIPAEHLLGETGSLQWFGPAVLNEDGVNEAYARIKRLTADEQTLQYLRALVDTAGHWHGHYQWMLALWESAMRRWKANTEESDSEYERGEKIRQMTLRIEQLNRDRDLIDDDLRRLGVALGHEEPGALPYSAAVLMKQYIDEVATLRRKVKGS